MCVARALPAAVLLNVLAGIVWAQAGDALSNRALIAAMPDDIEAVMVLRAEPLLRDECALKREMQGFFGIRSDLADTALREQRDIVSSGGDNNLDRIVFAELLARKPTRRVLAGAKFQPPDGIGVGAFDYLALWITGESNEPIRQRVAAGEGIVGQVAANEGEGVTLYTSPVQLVRRSARGAAEHVDRVACIAFPTQHVTIVAFSQEHARHVARQLQAPTAEIPKHWRAVADGLDLEAPIVILRAFPQKRQQFPKPVSPGNIEVGEVEIDSYGITNDGGSTVAFHLRAITEYPENAQAYFHYPSPFQGGFPPDSWKWNRQADARGLTADVAFIEGDGRKHHSSLLLLTLFGIMLAI